MHLGRFHKTIELLNSEFVESKLSEHLQSLITALNAVATSPGTAETATAYKAQLEQLRQVLQASTFNRTRPILTSILESIGAQEFVGDFLFGRVKAAIENNHLMPTLAVQELTTLHKAVQAFYQSIAAIDTAFTKLQVEYDDLEAGEGELGLLIPREDGKSTLKDVSKELNQWHNALSPIAELFDPAAGPIQIKTCSTTDWMIYLATSASVLAGVSICLKGVNAILKDILDMQNLIEQFAAKKTPEKLVEELKKNNESKLETEIRALAEKLVDDRFEGGDQGRANELKNGISHSLSTIAHKVSIGAKIELRLVPPERPAPAPNAETGEVEQPKLSEADESLLNLSLQLDQDIELISFNGDTQGLRGLLTSPEPEEKP